MSRPAGMDGGAMRQIRSFVLRQGRLTPGQQGAFERLWQDIGIQYQPAHLELQSCFPSDQPVILEIGFGNGDSLAQMAQMRPDLNFIGIEVHRPGVGRLLLEIEKRGLQNLRIISHDAVNVLQHCIRPASLAGVQVFFPDPWHKKRHHKRRIIQGSFLDLLAEVIVPGGFLHLATDWENYAEQMCDVIEAHPLFENTSDTGFITRPESRPLTKFEQRGQRLGHIVRDLYALRTS